MYYLLELYMEGLYMKHIIISGKRDVPVLFLMQNTLHDFGILLFFIFASAFFQYAEGMWEDWYTYVVAFNLLLIFWIIRKSLQGELRLYNSIFDAISQADPIDESSFEDRAERLKKAISAYSGIRNEQRKKGLAGRMRNGETICYLLIILSVLEMLALRFM